MVVRFLRGSAPAIVCLFSAQAAYAELTAQDVWSDWRDYLGSSGYEVSANEQMLGDTLTISDMTLTLPVPEEEIMISVVIPSLALRENSDGTVSGQIPSPLPIRFSVAEPGDDAEVQGELVLTHTNMVMTIAGSPDNMTYDHSSDRMELAIGNVIVEGDLIPESLYRGRLTMTDWAGTTKMVKGDLRDFDQNYSAGTVTYDIAFDDPKSEDQGELQGTLQQLAVTGTGRIPNDMDPSDMSMMLKSGFAVDAKISFGSGNSSIRGTGDGENFSMTSSSRGGSLAVSMDASQLAYNVEGKGLAVSVTSGAFPFPVSFELGETLFKIAVPVAKSDEEQDFAFGLTLGGFVVSDAIWNLFDPGATLPRDPATIAVDVNGKAKVFVDILDPDAAGMLGGFGSRPGALNALTLNNLLLSAVGARLSGAGDFTFDNTDLETFDGFPRPIGAVELQLDGANALLDSLISMGIVGNEEAMGSRMMMGMLAVPGDGPDSLKSQIEFNEQGHILANGQRIQ